MKKDQETWNIEMDAAFARTKTASLKRSIKHHTKTQKLHLSSLKVIFFSIEYNTNTEGKIHEGSKMIRRVVVFEVGKVITLQLFCVKVV